MVRTAHPTVARISFATPSGGWKESLLKPGYIIRGFPRFMQDGSGTPFVLSAADCAARHSQLNLTKM